MERVSTPVRRRQSEISSNRYLLSPTLMQCDLCSRDGVQSSRRVEFEVFRRKYSRLSGIFHQFSVSLTEQRFRTYNPFCYKLNM